MKNFFRTILFLIFSITSIQCMDNEFFDETRSIERLHELEINSIETRLEEINSEIPIEINSNEEEFLFEQLIQALNKQYWNVVEFLIRNNENINTGLMYDDYTNPLTLALEKNAPLEIIVLLIIHGADVNYDPVDNDWHNDTPLGICITQNKSYLITTALISAGANVDYQYDPFGGNYIDIAVTHDDLNGYKNLNLLLSQGASFDTCMNNPLTSAINNNKSIFIINLLLHFGVQVYEEHLDLIRNYTWPNYTQYYEPNYLQRILEYCMNPECDRNRIARNYETLNFA